MRLCGRCGTARYCTGIEMWRCADIAQISKSLVKGISHAGAKLPNSYPLPLCAHATEKVCVKHTGCRWDEWQHAAHYNLPHCAAPHLTTRDAALCCTALQHIAPHCIVSTTRVRTHTDAFTHRSTKRTALHCTALYWHGRAQTLGCTVFLQSVACHQKSLRSPSHPGHWQRRHDRWSDEMHCYCYLTFAPSAGSASSSGSGSGSASSSGSASGSGSGSGSSKAAQPKVLSEVDQVKAKLAANAKAAAKAVEKNTKQLNKNSYQFGMEHPAGSPASPFDGTATG